MDSILLDERSAVHTRLDIQADQRRARNFAWEAVKGTREDVNAFYLDGLSMLRRGKDAGLTKEALVLMGRALYDAVGECIGQMEQALDKEHCALDPAQVDRSELDAFLESVK